MFRGKIMFAWGILVFFFVLELTSTQKTKLPSGTNSKPGKDGEVTNTKPGKDGEDNYSTGGYGNTFDANKGEGGKKNSGKDGKATNGKPGKGGGGDNGRVGSYINTFDDNESVDADKNETRYQTGGYVDTFMPTGN